MAPDSTWQTGVVDTTGVAPGSNADLRSKAPAVEWPAAPANGGHPAIAPDGVEHQPVDVTKTGTVNIAGDRGDTTGTSTLAPPTGPPTEESVEEAPESTEDDSEPQGEPEASTEDDSGSQEGEEATEDDAPEQPAKNASTEAWREYALALGGDPASVNEASRDDLIAAYGSEG